MNPIFRGKIEKGKLIISNQIRFQVHLARLEGQDLDVVVRKHKSQRSSNQNKYYWKIVIEILSDYTGYEAEEVHEMLKFKFLKKGPEGLETVVSTAKLNTAEFEDYLEKVRRWAAIELKVFIPLPNDYESAVNF